MKKLIVLALLLAGYSYGWENSFKVTATGGAPIPAAFNNADPQSLVASAMVNNKSFCVFNETGTRISLNTEQASTATPSTVTHYVPAGTLLCDEQPVRYLFIKSDGIAIVAGVVHGFFR